MNLMDPKQKWIPNEWQSVYNQYAIHSAWYSANPETLANLYATHLVNPSPQGSFWARKLSDERRVAVHVPLARDISAVSASLLFGEPVQIRVPEDTANAEATGSRLSEIVKATDFNRKLLEGAEIASAMGGVYVKINWDTNRFPFPVPAICQPDNVIPDFYPDGMGLRSCIFWKEVHSNKQNVWRLLEIHTTGQIETLLFLGDEDTLGSRISLESLTNTAGIQEIISTGLPGLAAFYIPNRLPNTRFRGMDVGASDYQGLESLMDSLDDAATSLIRDVRHGYSRILAPDAFLKFDPDNPGIGGLFDMDQEVFTPLNVLVDGDQGLSSQVQQIQFDIRSEAHLTIMKDLTFKIISAAGYSPQTFGLDVEGRAESGTALAMRERKSYSTTAKKASYWCSGLERLFEALLLIDKNVFGSQITPIKPIVEIQDSARQDIHELAATADFLRRSESASASERVKLIHPDWNEATVQAEVDKIYAELGIGTEAILSLSEPVSA